MQESFEFDRSPSNVRKVRMPPILAAAAAAVSLGIPFSSGGYALGSGGYDYRSGHRMGPYRKPLPPQHPTIRRRLIKARRRQSHLARKHK